MPKEIYTILALSTTSMNLDAVVFENTAPKKLAAALKCLLVAWFWYLNGSEFRHRKG